MNSNRCREYLTGVSDKNVVGQNHPRQTVFLERYGVDIQRIQDRKAAKIQHIHG